ncbi:unnamed protein product [Caenorhabditis angaria]|uniref:TIL domain-containing protein n=1 Tax=Caenorhabditis angaria TaxID=860376 RepID=A0A9P1IU81_9PELO|nr:unnamed protein product [Caenorhabditis angaria]
MVFSASTLPECGENEELKYCGTPCEPSCAEPHPDECFHQCLRNRCQCKDDYLRDGITKKCVKSENCTKKN